MSADWIQDREPLLGKVAAVTGASFGIGRATAISLARAGASVGLIFRDESRGKDVLNEITRHGGAAVPIRADLNDPGAVAALADTVAKDIGGIDILVNCAGYRVVGLDKLLTITDAAWDSIHQVNLKAPAFLMQSAAKAMIEQGRGGHIVNVLSSSAFRAVAASAAYSAAKAALGQLTRVAAAELGGFGINVNAVAPGATRTHQLLQPGGEESLQEQVRNGPLANLLQRVSDPQDVANVILFLCTQSSRQITGQVIHTSAGAVI
jgi:NAD(P)-dependent dehydrogenase (short-subunit alcohol dehydrogenase family)